MYFFALPHARLFSDQDILIITIPPWKESCEETFLAKTVLQLSHFSGPLLALEPIPQLVSDSKDLEIENLLRSLEERVRVYVRHDEHLFVEKTETFFVTPLPECTCAGIIPKPLEVIRGPPTLPVMAAFSFIDFCTILSIIIFTCCCSVCGKQGGSYEKEKALLAACCSRFRSWSHRSPCLGSYR